MTHEEIHREALDNFKLYENIEQDNLTEAVGDFKFYAGEQWAQEIRNQRANKGRPCLTFNHLPQFVKQVTNDQRQNKPQIKISPVEDGDTDVAEVVDGLVRSIQRSSQADVAYDTAFEHSVIGGFGYWRILTQYVSDTSIEQKIVIERINDCMSVAMQPLTKDSCGSDVDWCFIYEDMPVETYKRLYPNSELANVNVVGRNDIMADWVGQDYIRVAEYFKVEYTKDTLYVFSDGSTILKSQIAKEGKDLAKFHLAGERETEIRKVMWYKMNGKEILEEQEWPGKYIPVVRVVGNELYVKGKKKVWGLVRMAKDPQMMLNFWRTSETESVGNTPKAPWLIAEGQIEGFQDVWESQHLENRPALVYKHIDGIPMPQRIQPSSSPIGDINAALSCVDEMKAVTGIYDASLGAHSNEVSGKAIIARKQSGENSTFNYIDNMARALRYTGLILVDLIPKIYSTERAIRILGKDMKERVVKVNSEYGSDGKIYDLTTGEYDVTVDIGPSYSTQRKEAADFLTQIMQTNPGLSSIIADIAIKSMDVPGAEEAAARIKKTLPPNLLDDGKGDKPSQEQIEQINAQLHQTLEEQQKYMDEIEKHLQAVAQENSELKKKSEVELEKEKIRASAQIEAKKIEQETALAVEDKKLGMGHLNEIVKAENKTHIAEISHYGKMPSSGGDYESLAMEIERLKKMIEMLSHNVNVPAQSPGIAIEINNIPSSEDSDEEDSDSNPEE